MCGRFAQVFEEKDLDHIERIVRAMCKDDIEIPPVDYNIAPTKEAVVVPEAFEPRVLRRARFGLIPSWSDDETIGSRLINARSETVREKPAFRNLVRSRRCVVPMTGFYEWQSVVGERRKRPWYIHRSDGDPILAAGLWETWSHSGSELDTFTVLTRAPDRFMSTLHERMPVVLEPEDAPAWLDPGSTDREVDALIAAESRGVLTGHRVSTRVNSPVHNDPGLVEEDASGDQGSLFG